MSVRVGHRSAELQSTLARAGQCLTDSHVSGARAGHGAYDPQDSHARAGQPPNDSHATTARAGGS